MELYIIGMHDRVCFEDATTKYIVDSGDVLNSRFLLTLMNMETKWERLKEKLVPQWHRDFEKTLSIFRAAPL